MTESEAKKAYKAVAYRLLKDSTLCSAKAGDTVYDLRGWDYGLANDDTRMTGIEHTSVTLKDDGDYPSFTVAKRDLERLP